MNRNVSLPLALAIIAFAISVIGLGLWFHSQMISVPSPGLMQPTAWNTGLIRVQGRVLEVDTHGTVVRTIQLEEYGAADSSDVALLSPEEILVYRDNRPHSFLENIQSYLRMEQDIDNGPGSELGLYRCHLGTGTCDPFTTLWQNPGRLLRFAIHPDGTVAISDTSHHQIFLFDHQGQPLHRLAKGLKFPNQIRWYENQLWIANTNRHKLDSFAQSDLSPLQGAPELDMESQYRFPTAFTRVGDEWWILVKDPSLSNGQLLTFDSQWNPKGDVTLPEGTDAVSLLSLGKHIYISDIESLRVHRMDSSDGDLQEFIPAEFESLLTDARQEQAFYRIAMWSTVGAFVTFLIGGLAFGLYLEYRHPDDHASERQGMTPEEIARQMPEGHPKEYWIPKDAKKLKVLKQMPYVVALMLLLLILMLILAPGSWRDTLVLIVAIAIAAVPSLLVRRYWQQANLGIALDMILIRYEGNTVAGVGREIKKAPGFLMIENQIIPIGRGRQSFFQHQELKRWIEPRLYNAETISSWRMFKALYRQRHPVWIMGMVIISGVLVLWLAMMF